MAGHGERLTRKQELALAALLAHDTLAAAAAAAGVNEKTLRAWQRLPAFEAAYRAARAEVLERTVARLLAICGKAVDRLGKNLDAASPQASTRAAVAILAHAIKGV